MSYYYIDIADVLNLYLYDQYIFFYVSFSSTDEHKQAIFDADGIEPILTLARSASDVRVQRNACGALLNLTHLRKFFLYFFYLLNHTHVT